MSFSTAIDSFVNRVKATTGFTTKSIIPNPYSIADNPEVLLRDGVGFVIGASTDSNQQFNATTDRQQIGVVISKLYVMSDSNPDVILGLVKALKDEAEVLRVSLLQETNLADIQDVIYTSTDEVRLVERYIYLTVNFEIRYTTAIPC